MDDIDRASQILHLALSISSKTDDDSLIDSNSIENFNTALESINFFNSNCQLDSNIKDILMFKNRVDDNDNDDDNNNNNNNNNNDDDVINELIEGSYDLINATASFSILLRNLESLISKQRLTGSQLSSELKNLLETETYLSIQHFF